MGRALVGSLIAIVATGEACGPPTTPVGGRDLDPAAVTSAWQAPLGQDHPLVGRVWSRAEARLVTLSDLIERLAGARFVLLGEKHDNPDHHRLQAWIVRALGERVQAVAFEMLDEDDGLALAERPPSDAGALAERWRDGWGPYSLYQPVVAATLAAGARVVAANPGKGTLQPVRRGGLAALTPERRRELRVDEPLEAAELAALEAEITAAHCGHANGRMLAVMTAVQQLKDAWMAAQLDAAAGAGAAVLIAGGGHVVRGRAVPLYLARRGRQGVVSVGFVEVRDGREAPDADAMERFDYAVFTPRVDDADPCDRFREMLERMKKGHSRGELRSGTPPSQPE